MIRPLFPDDWSRDLTADRRMPVMPVGMPYETPVADLLGLLSTIQGKLDIDHWASKLGERPCENMLAIVGTSAAIFYHVEKNHNPKVKDYWDALVYCSTCISVGYGDIFAHTPVGKIIGSALMAIGPALAAKTLDGPAPADTEDVQRETLATLKEILATLQAKDEDR